MGKITIEDEKKGKNKSGKKGKIRVQRMRENGKIRVQRMRKKEKNESTEDENKGKNKSGKINIQYNPIH